MAQEFEKKEITPKSRNFSTWYNEVVLKAELADYGPARGTMIFRPLGFALWENIQGALDGAIKAAGVKNVYFPMFIPERLLRAEKEHVEGFSPQLAVVTIGGGEKLAEPLVIRPTSETVMYEAFARWISSWRDLPLKINQWGNVVRWEKRTALFLRTSEFLWQEGHTVHATHEEAEKEALRALSLYQDFYQAVLAIPALVGVKSQAEKFAGAARTYTVELLMPDGKALQGATSHDLGQNFSKVFKINFQDKAGKLNHVWQTSWGLSSRSIGALIMVHGDDLGAIFPPALAPTQVVVVPIWDKDKKKVADYAQKVAKTLEENFRVEVDLRDEYTPGWKFADWELRGVPLRAEVGPEEVKGGFVTLVRRDSGEKLKVPAFANPPAGRAGASAFGRRSGLRPTKSAGKKSENLPAGKAGLKVEVGNLLEKIQKNLFARAQDFVKENTHQAKEWSEFDRIMRQNRGFIWAFWCQRPECEREIKEATKATTRLLPLDARAEKGVCVHCGRSASLRWLFAQGY